MSRQSSGRGSANRRTVNLDDTDEPYQMSNRQEVGQYPYQLQQDGNATALLIRFQNIRIIVHWPPLKFCSTDTTYSDPLGPQAERPKTAARRRDMEDEWENEELGDDLLPE